MSSPRHLWSGDWESDSAAVTEELGRRRQGTAPPVEPRPEPPAPARARRPALASNLLWLRRQASAAREGERALRQRAREAARARAASARPAGRRRLRIVLLAGLVGLLSAAIAYGVVTLLAGSGGPTVTSAGTAQAWLGVDLTRDPFGNGVIIADVAPGGPAQTAGLAPGDLITAIDGKPASTLGAVSSALHGLHAGSQVEIQYTLGLAIPGSFTTHATLAAEPPGYP